ncbi:S9 family peptidase [candidate division KSB1 bacterium]|nr:S9 family peptidase [candidate division KSB1 bacterium]
MLLDHIEIPNVIHFVFFSLALFPLFVSATQKIKPPRAEKKPHKHKIHGHERIDNYYWMRDRENPQVLDYLHKENEYAETVLAPLKGLRRKLFQEMKLRIKEDETTVPYKLGPYNYYTRYEEGREYPIYCRKKGSLRAKEQLLLDVNIPAEHHRYYKVMNFNVSPDHKTAAFAADSVGRRLYTIYFIDLQTGRFLKDKIDKVSPFFEWANDNKTLFYMKQNPQTLRFEKIFKHELGVKKNTLVYFESDETFITKIYKTRSQKYLLIGSFSTLASEFRYLDANSPDGDFKVFYPRKAEHEYYIDHGGDTFFILTNDGAVNFKLKKTPVDKIDRKNWKEVVPQNKNIFIQRMAVFQNHIVLQEKKNGLTSIRIINRSDKKQTYLDFTEETYTAYIGTNPEYKTDILRFGYESLTFPRSVYDYHINTKTKVLKKSQPVLGDFDPQNYRSKRIFARARDGAGIPISMVFKKGLERDGKNPLLLHAYGSYGHSEDPFFSSARLSLLDRGFIFAIAHIRGGSEMGRQWYEQGRQLKKKNSFTDFIACAELLIQKKYTAKEHLYAIGGSAGGLLMGAVINMRPDLFHGVIAEVPFVDVITTMLDSSIPLTTYEYNEWGNPNNKEYYDYMLSYSPYDNVGKKDYPHLLVTTGLHDSQVQYWEPAKWAARLRDMKTNDTVLLLKTDFQAGHSGASGRFESLKETVLNYAFILGLEGIQK